MKKRAIISKKIFVRMIITALTLFSLSLNTTTVTSSIYSNTTSEPSIIALTPHDPIEITSDSDFEVFPGSGTAEDPYLIDDYNITTTDSIGIYINGTTKYFTVHNCYVDANDYGIYIRNVADGTANVISNTCNNNNGLGICFFSSSSSTIANNTCNNNNHGIHLSSSSSSTVANNMCNDNWDGISLSSSVSSTVANNTCNNCRISLEYSGSSTISNNTCNNCNIFLFSSGGSTIGNNTCTNNNNGWGIYLESSDSSTVSNNTSNNNRYGIYLWYSDYCVVAYNLLQGNEGYGVYFWFDSDNNIINYNTFVDNNVGGSSQAYDDGTSNSWYDPETKEGNYWLDLGNKCTYKIDGKAHSKDLYPLNRAQSCPNPVVIITISIVTPILVSAAILAFVVPKYVIPYTRKTIIPRFAALWLEKKTRRRKK